MTPNEKELQGVQKSMFEDLPVADGGLGGAIDLARQGGRNDTSGEWFYHAPSAQHRWRAYCAGWKAARTVGHHEMHTTVSNVTKPPSPPSNNISAPSNEATILEMCCIVRGIDTEGNDGTLLRRINDQITAALIAWGSADVDNKINRENMSRALLAANAQAPVATPGCYPVGVIQDAIASRIPREFSAWQKWPGTRVLADAVIDALKIRSLSLAAPAQPAVAPVADYLTAQGKEAQAIEAAKPTVNAALYPTESSERRRQIRSATVWLDEIMMRIEQYRNACIPDAVTIKGQIYDKIRAKLPGGTDYHDPSSL